MSTMDIREAWKKTERPGKIENNLSVATVFYERHVANFSILSKTDVDMYSSSV